MKSIHPNEGSTPALGAISWYIFNGKVLSVYIILLTLLEPDFKFYIEISIEKLYRVLNGLRSPFKGVKSISRSCQTIIPMMEEGFSVNHERLD